MSEEDMLQVRQVVNQLVTSHNQIVKKVESYERYGVAEKAMESHYMLSTLIELLVEKGVFTADDVQRVAMRVQTRDLGLVDKGGVAEVGDTILMKFKLMDGDKIVDDQTASPFAYTVGSNAFSCDAELVGIQKGDTRTLTAVFGPEFKFREYAGKDLTMVVHCVGVMAKQVQTEEATAS